MKKIFILFLLSIIVIVIAIAIYFHHFSPLKIATKAEIQGKYEVAIENFIKTALKYTQSTEYPDKNKALTLPENEWINEITKYLSLVNYAIPNKNKDHQIAMAGIKRCTSYVTNYNFITQKKPKHLVPTVFKNIWKTTFFRDNDSDINHKKLIDRALRDSISIITIRAMNGYNYHTKLLDLQTGCFTNFILYPNSTISLLVKPRKYFLICSSEVQFTQGLSGKTWRSPHNIIPLDFSQKTSQYKVTLKTKVRRSK